MPLDNEEFKFPDEKSEGKKDDKIEFEVEGESKAEIEVVDDTPLEDRNRKPMAEPPKELTDDELNKYDEGVRKRIQHFTKGYHEERRAKEKAEREREEALGLRKRLPKRTKNSKVRCLKARLPCTNRPKNSRTMRLSRPRQRCGKPTTLGIPTPLFTGKSNWPLPKSSRTVYITSN
jgi:septal ring factor EnvC (AmiA/AmiB activator)